MTDRSENIGRRNFVAASYKLYIVFLPLYDIFLPICLFVCNEGAWHHFESSGEFKVMPWLVTFDRWQSCAQPAKVNNILTKELM